MSEHRLERIEREEGVNESRFHFVCTCGTLGPDHGAATDLSSEELRARRMARADFKLHSEGKSTSEAPDQSGNPGVDVWAERIEREGR